MESIGIRDLRANLATAARRAEAGERVVVTIDGQPVAQLGPVEPVDRQLSIHDLAARGLITPARRSDRPAPEFVLPMWAGTRTDQLVREIRGR
ncbi:MAG: type II toxin-antitoxin system Phd/YefM family antitoxin [Microthrixaceae bacterium]